MVLNNNLVFSLLKLEADVYHSGKELFNEWKSRDWCKSNDTHVWLIDMTFTNFQKTVWNYNDFFFFKIPILAKMCNSKTKMVLIWPNWIIMKVYEVKFIDQMNGWADMSKLKFMEFWKAFFGELKISHESYCLIFSKKQYILPTEMAFLVLIDMQSHHF